MANSVAVPATSFITAVLLWIAFFVLHLTGRLTHVQAPWPGTVLCLVVSGLIVFSGFKCVRMNGPRVGHIVRTGVLLVMMLLTYWKICLFPTLALAVGVVVAGSLAFLTPDKTAAGSE